MDQIKILLIEDNPGDARIIKKMLAEEKIIKFDIIWENCLAKGLKRLSEGGFDVILLDLMLPDSIGGFYTFSKIQAEAQHIPIIVMTGFDDESFAESTIQIGAQGYFIKGKVDSNQLIRTINNAIETELAEKAGLKNTK